MILNDILLKLFVQSRDIPIVPIPDAGQGDFWKSFKGMSFDEIISKLANGLVSFAFKLALAVLVFYLGRFIIRKLYKWIFRVMTHRHVDASLTTFVLSLVKMTLYFILIITIIGIIGLETSSFLAIFASAGVAIGMALSGTLQNFAGGVLILLLKPYKVGDFIEVQGYQGTVKSIQLFNTVINTIDNKAIIIPNGMLSNSSINNFSLESYRRVDWTVCLSYGTDLEKAKSAILEIINSDDRVIKDEPEAGGIAEKGELHEDLDRLPGLKMQQPPFVGLNEMADSSINIVVRAWTHASNYWTLYFEINERFYNELPQKGFSFPFPQMDVHIDGQN